MKGLKKGIALAMLMAMCGTSIHNIEAQDYVSGPQYSSANMTCEPCPQPCAPCVPCDPCTGYEASCEASWKGPAIALGAVAIVAIIAVCASQGSSHHRCKFDPSTSSTISHVHLF